MDSVTYGEPDALSRPFCSQRFMNPPERGDVTVASLERVPLPFRVVYRHDDHEVYLGSLILLSLRTIARTGFFAVCYHGHGTHVRTWTLEDSEHVRTCVVDVAEDSCPLDDGSTQSVTAFVAEQLAAKHEADARADRLCRNKCVNGVYVPSPELTPWEDDDFFPTFSCKP